MTSVLQTESGAVSRALVTGATGYLGRRLVKLLLLNGWQVDTVVRPTSSLHDLRNAQMRLVNHSYDGTVERLAAIVRGAKPDIVFHLAAASAQSHKREDIASIIQSNVVFGVQLAESMAAADCRRLINTGTFWQHYENRPYSPVNLYAASKQAFEAFLQYYVEVEAFKVITLKLFDVYGPADPRRKLIPMIKTAILRRETIDLSPGAQIIDLVHVDDVACAYVVAAQLLLSGAISGHTSYCISSGERLSLRDLIVLAEKVVDTKIAVRWGGRAYRQREVMVPCDPGPQLPGWNRKISLVTGLTECLQERSATGDSA